MRTTPLSIPFSFFRSTAVITLNFALTSSINLYTHLMPFFLCLLSLISLLFSFFILSVFNAFFPSWLTYCCVSYVILSCILPPLLYIQRSSFQSLFHSLFLQPF
ncbi:hypothetical protein EDI_336250 [Entamoeba dispar SAW760]|uniref:Uncharacterized protein n=1 Tax=Entamoeba dispar (strain ATCC PRA-260 / SAW760) TaxID=370354 RepID=B0ERT1_ENTDS|nr:uncharacterized protein EDI_336250 [Entamoeba dispar SAW760]EDR22726.1 hypothetical protein EDI_336250 [Entamoeba dispar SAW760]|eukprot:EDR22726.1 hypothetical protein EDI_336250 [Entamoeba dispar SAW760]